MVELEKVSYEAGGAHILSDVSVRFRTERFNVILGPNGAGKTTLLRIASGLLAPTRGAVRYGERLVGTFGAEALARRRAVLSQHVELAFPLPVEDVVMMGRYPHYGRTPSTRDRRIVDGALALVDLAAERGRSYPTLSGGEQQKVQLARVLAQIWVEDEAGEPTYLFLDEPTLNLDVHYQLQLLDVTRGLLGSRCTVIAVLHDLNVALQYGDSFVVLEHGRLALACDDPAELTAEFIERVFRVRAHRVTDAEGNGVWRFTR